MDTLLRDIGSAFIKDLVFLLKAEDSFLKQSPQERQKAMEHHFKSSYPSSLAQYLMELQADSFKSEFHHILQVLEEVAQADEKNQFLGALARFFTQEMGVILDTLPLDFFFRPLEERFKILNPLLPGVSALENHLRQWFSRSTYQEITLATHQALETLKNAPVIVIQTPIEMETLMRKELRDHFSQKHPYAFVEFQINPLILGGMRVLIDGQIKDHSWLSKVQAIMHLHSLSV